MIRMVLAQLRFRPGRAVALVGALVVAVTSFSVLTATASTQRLAVAGTVNRNARGAYDVLVRPAGSTSATEAGDGLVSSTASTGLSGGITEDQWRRILAIPGVDVAAPVAVVGYTLQTVRLPVDLSSALDPAARSQVLRVRTTQVSERGLTRVPTLNPYQNSDYYAYITGNPLHTLTNPQGSYSNQTPLEIGPNGAARPVCVLANPGISSATNSSQAPDVALTCGSTNADDDWNASGSTDAPAAGTTVVVSFPSLIEAVDPVQEAKLAGLDGAVGKGSYFTPDQGPVERSGTQGQLFGTTGLLAGNPVSATEIPMLIASGTAVDEQLELAVSRLPADAAAQVAGGATNLALAKTLPSMPETPVTTFSVDAQQAYRKLVDVLEHPAGPYDAGLTEYLTAHPLALTPTADGLAPSVLTPGSNKLLPTTDLSYQVGTGDLSRSGDLVEPALRGLEQHTAKRDLQNRGSVAPQIQIVGEFDPAKLRANQAGLGAVPMETYFPAQATGADALSKTALDGRTLLPNGNIRGLLSVPPTMITTLSALAVLDDPTRFENAKPELGVDRAAPISAVRVRLSGALGVDPLSRERVRLVAQEIKTRTGLDVDITVGSSPAPVTVLDPAGAHGRPALRLAELWSRKGVAAVIVAAIDRKSLILFVLVLCVCALFTAGATGAAVRSRRPELGVLACLGWPARRLFALLLGEVAAEGLVAGLAGAALAIPAGSVAGVHVSVLRAVTAVPAAVMLALAAASWPAFRAARADPGAAVAVAVSGPRRAVRLAGITRLALANLRRTPGRTVLGASALALGVGALVALAGIATAFSGTVTGTLMGDAVSVQVRGTDVAAAVIALLLGMVTVADVVYLNIRERSGELALLRAVGWRDRALNRLVLTEAAVMAAVGAGGGAGAAVLAEAAFAGRFTPGLIVTGAVTAVGAVVFAVAAAAVPTVAIHRAPAAPLLAEG
ncbi:hypothetical protein GCM10009839_07300 [Catenulispora yoronensis]|uniref:ABC3 transporter permease C-terminal domain-containing protein n=1 Tax=Catenulispora yoronensis TaxID=450799 RepID=A0ABP5F5N7_9ACTN